MILIKTGLYYGAAALMICSRLFMFHFNISYFFLELALIYPCFWSVFMHIKVREFITNGATKVCVISVHVKLYLCVAGTRVRACPRVGRWWVKMPGPFLIPVRHW